MNAVDFLKAKDEMCATNECRHCPLSQYRNTRHKTCEEMMSLHPDEAVYIVEQWAENHPDVISIHYISEDGYTENIRKAINFEETSYGDYWEVKR